MRDIHRPARPLRFAALVALGGCFAAPGASPGACQDGTTQAGRAACDDGARYLTACERARTTAGRLVTGGAHTCALLATGAVRCWGDGEAGELGHGDAHSIGDDPGETPATAGDVHVGGRVAQIEAGGMHTCARLETGAVRCWGAGWAGQLGHGNTGDIGDDETPATAGDVDVGGVVVQLATGSSHTCALLEADAVRCWGHGVYGRLGYGNASSIGDDEPPASAGDVPYRRSPRRDHRCSRMSHCPRFPGFFLPSSGKLCNPE